MSWIKLIQFLPELIKIVKSISRQIKQGQRAAEIRKDLKEIDNAFKQENPVNRARALDDVFNK